LVALIQDGRIDIARGDTELECVARVRHAYADAGAATQTKPDYFHSLVKIWQRVAYARERVPNEQVAALIDAWSTHFEIHRVAENATAPATAANKVAA
jgi:Domain of unknown function (DUF4129)